MEGADGACVQPPESKTNTKGFLWPPQSFYYVDRVAIGEDGERSAQKRDRRQPRYNGHFSTEPLSPPQRLLGDGGGG